MNKTLLLVLAGGVFAGSTSLFGQAAAPAPAAPAPSWTLTPAVVSQYMFRGVRLGGPSFQPTVEFGYGSLAAGVWANFPIKDKVPGVSDPEYDLYGSYTFALNDASSVVVGATWYMYPRADESAGFYENTFEPSIAFNYTIEGLKLTPKLYYDMVLEGPTLELTAAYAVPLKEMGTELQFTAVAGTYKWDEAAENSSPSVKNWGNYWSVGVAMPFQITSNSKLTLGVSYVRGYDNFVKAGTAGKSENTAAIGRGVGSIAYSISF